MMVSMMLKYLFLLLAMAVIGVTSENRTVVDIVPLDDRCRECRETCPYGPNYTVINGAYSESVHNQEEYENLFSKMDTAALKFVSKCNHAFTIRLRSSECYNCSYSTLVTLAPFTIAYVVVETNYDTDLQVMLNTIPNPTKVCSERIKFWEYGNYTYYISPNISVMDGSERIVCVLTSGDIPSVFNMPVCVMLAVIFLVSAFWILIVFLDKRYFLYERMCFRIHRMVNDDFGIPATRSTSSTNLDENPRHGFNEITGQPAVKIRLLSLDTFRGLSVTLMIFVNYGGGEYWYFQHAAWNGLHVADLVFPWFIFIMGTSMVFSLNSQISRNTPLSEIILKILKRSVILIVIGLILNSTPTCPDKVTHFEKLRIPGVLQRIGVTYFFTSLIHLACVYKTNPGKAYIIAEWIVHLILLTVYLCLTFLLPVPGCPTGYLGPGGLADQGMYANCTGGSAGYIDRLVFGSNHMYSRPTSMAIYGGSVAYDPEGLLGCFTSIFLCFLGIQAGKTFQLPNWKSTVCRQMIFCIISTGFGVLLCQARKEGGWIPINKNLWSLSFVLCIAGTSFLLLTIFYISVDRFKFWSGAPFFFVGINPFLMYILHEVFQFYIPVKFNVPDDHWSQLALDCWGTVFWLLVAYVLHRKKIYFSI